MRAAPERVSLTRRVVAIVATLSITIGLLVLSDASAVASGSPAEPFPIRAASLTQDGQQLVWKVELGSPFSAAGLARGHRTLCLLIERVGSGAVWGQVCVTPPAGHSDQARATYMKVIGGQPGRAVAVDAVVTRPSASELDASFLPSAVDLRYGPIRWQVISTVRSGSSSLSVLSPAKPTLLKLHTPKLVGCEASGPSVTYRGSSHGREIALTFDDGPWNDPPTSQFLGMLEREHVPATFFEIGDQISTYDPGGALARRMLADGDMIGDHTWSHPDMATLSPRQQRTQLLSAADAIERATHGFTPCLWRPPYGASSPSLVSLARSLGMLTIMWDIDPRDWATPGAGAIYSNVVGNAHNGAIVLQHFGGGPRYETLSAVPQEISTLRARGYKFVTVGQLLGLKLVYR